MAPCALCTNEYEKLIEKRSNELERVLIEHIRDGYEEPLPDNIHDEILKETVAETRRQKKLTQKNRKGKGKNISNDSRLHRLKLITKTNLALTHDWRKKQQHQQQQSHQLHQQMMGSNYNHFSTSNNSLSEENFELKSQQINNLVLKPKIQTMNDNDNDNGDHDHAEVSPPKKPPNNSLSLFNAAKFARKLSSISVKSKSNLRLFSAEDPILSIRPLENISYCCIIHAKWFDNWKRYIQSGHFEDIEYPVLEPGPITNHLLLKNPSKCLAMFKKSLDSIQTPNSSSKLTPTSSTSLSQQPQQQQQQQQSSNTLTSPPSFQISNNLLKKDLHYNYDYVVVSPNVWRVLYEIYGGGPPIFREDISIYSQEYSIIK